MQNMTRDELVYLVELMKMYGYTNNRRIDYIPNDWPEGMRKLFEKGREYPEELKISAETNPEAYFREMKRIIAWLIEDIEELEKAFGKEG
jgi:hypothetical protein